MLKIDSFKKKKLLKLFKISEKLHSIFTEIFVNFNLFLCKGNKIQNSKYLKS